MKLIVHIVLYCSDLDPMQAPLWTVRVTMAQDIQCLLGKWNYRSSI